MEALFKKVRITCSVVNKIRNHLSQRILLLLCNSMIKSHLQYCIMTWCNGNKTMIKQLQSAANKFIRIIFGLSVRDSVIDVMQKHGIFSINQLKESEMASFTVCISICTVTCPKLFKIFVMIAIGTVATVVKQEVSLNFFLLVPNRINKTVAKISWPADLEFHSNNYTEK